VEGINMCISDPFCRNFESFLLDRIVPIEPWTMEDSVAVSKLLIYFMIHDNYQELIRSYVDASFADSPTLKDFADRVLITDLNKSAEGKRATLEE
jgi:hypothetical protein